ncbi:hypothetical protein [Dyadobacter sp. CY326]|uniref:hypothetical protein n=1 Tax=Dyadobacter sp. CY326 TaxID=2907300 RepID=UPI001F3606E8|nr:hypothetical protein [Dyadobacter sp. CY326]MCE7067445.1 hypothetical protein [Dyadobacter sp. CY326]
MSNRSIQSISSDTNNATLATKPSYIKQRLTFLPFLTLIFVLIAAALINYNYSNRLDIISDDDDLYFSFGMMLLEGKYRGADDGPLYYAFQLLLQLITNDAIKTFYINYIITSTVPFILLYLLLRGRNINIWIAAIITIMFMFSSLNYPVTPKLTHYAIVFLLLGLLAFTYCKDLTHKLSTCCFFVFLAAYARPELYIAFFLLYAVTGYVCLREKKLRYVFLMLSITIICGYFLGTPIGERDRSFWTFKHHFSINYIESNPQLNLSPWNHFNQITTNAFGHKLVSIKDAIITNPVLVFWHIKLNIIHYIKIIPSYFADIIFNNIQFPFRKYVILFFGFLLAIRTDYQKSYENIVLGFRQNLVFIIIFLLMLAPTYISNFFIYPRTHYILYHFFLYMYLFAMLCNCVAFKKISLKRNWLADYAAIGFSILIISLLYISQYKESAQFKPLPSKEFSLMLRNCKLKGKISALGGDAPFSYNRYVGQNWSFNYYDIIRPERFDKCIVDYKVNCVIINDKMNSYFASDSTYKLFLNHPELIGFVLVKKTKTHQVYAKHEGI